MSCNAMRCNERSVVQFSVLVFAYGPKTSPAFLHFFSSDYFGAGVGGWSLVFVRYDLRSDRLLYFVHLCHVILVLYFVGGRWGGGVGLLTSLVFVRHNLRSDRLLYFVFTHHVMLDTSSLLRCTYFHVTSDTSSLLRSNIMLGWGRLLYFVAHTCMFRWIRLLYFFNILWCFVGYVFSTSLHILSCYVGYVFSTLFSHIMLCWIRLLHFVAHTFMLCWIRLLDFFAHTFMLRWIRLLYLDSTSLHILSCYVTFTLETIKKMTWTKTTEAAAFWSCTCDHDDW